MATAQSHSSILLYDDALGQSVENWSWTDTDVAATKQVASGEYALYGEMDAFDAIYIGMDSPVPVPAQGVLVFSIYSEMDTEVVVVTSSSGVGDGVPKVMPIAGGQWQTHQVLLNELGVQQEIFGVWWQQFSELDSGGVYLDDM